MSQKVRVQTFLMVLLLGLSLFSLPLFSVWKKSAAATMLKETAHLQEKERMAKNVNLALRCQWFQLKSRRYIEAVAKKEMGLSYPKIEDVLVIRKERIGSLFKHWRPANKQQGFFRALFFKT